MTKCSSEAVSETSHEVEAGAPGEEEEIEVTPEMIEAGEEFVYRYNPDGPGYPDGGEVAAEVYRAMERVRRQAAMQG